MIETKNSPSDDKNYLKNNLDRKFFFVENLSELKKIKSSCELCVIKTDFDKSDLQLIKKVQKTNPDIEFWVCSENLSKENVLTANKIGIKTVVSSPIDYKMVEEFFNSKNDSSKAIKKINIDKYEYSSIASSKIMVVDDNPMNVELLSEILSEFNLNISCFLKSKEALKIALKEKFDLFLFDIMMPEMSGFELAKKIKDAPLNKNTPVIFVSALSDAHNKIQGYDIGSIAYIEKPFDVNIVKSQIFNLLKNQKAQEIVTSTKESFFATVAHDLKTPINAGINALKLLLNQNLGELEGEQQEIIEDILFSTRFMKDMVENVLSKNKIDNNRIVLSKEVLSLKETVENCIDLTKYILAPKKQKIDFYCDVDNPLIPIDFMEIKRSIHNLIANASEHSPVGSKIELKIFKVNNKIALSVKDFGTGIDLEHQKDVFDKYMSIAQKDKRVGSGLGLYITKKIIEAHGGEIILDSSLGFGTKITIFLPFYNKE